jgi:hypothetical protein
MAMLNNQLVLVVYPFVPNLTFGRFLCPWTKNDMQNVLQGLWPSSEVIPVPRLRAGG